MTPRRGPERDPAHVAFVRRMGCVVCGHSSEAHHHSVRGVFTRGMGQKASDHSCVPLCHTHHMEGHTRGWQTVQCEWGIDLRAVLLRILTERYLAAKEMKRERYAYHILRLCTSVSQEPLV